MSLAHWLSLLGICLLGAMSPGPSLAVVMRATLGGGRAAGYAAALAHGAGVGLYGLLTVAGLAVLVTGTPALYLALQVAGAAYLIYLGLGNLRGRRGTAPAAAPLRARARAQATSGFLVAFLNPKLAVFMLALFSQFLEPGFGLREKGLMALTVGVTDAVWYALVVSLLALPGFLDRLQRAAPLIDRCFGVILIALAVSVLAAGLG